MKTSNDSEQHMLHANNTWTPVNKHIVFIKSACIQDNSTNSVYSSPRLCLFFLMFLAALCRLLLAVRFFKLSLLVFVFFLSSGLVSVRIRPVAAVCFRSGDSEIPATLRKDRHKGFVPRRSSDSRRF